MLYKDMIETIKDEDIRRFTNLVIRKYKPAKKLEKDAYEVYKWVLFILRNDKILTSENPGYSMIIDVMKSAAVLHNILYDYSDKDFTNLFLLRITINEDKDITSSVPRDIIDTVCQVVESQLGKYNQVKLLIPNPNTPGAQFALACSLFYKAQARIDENLLEEDINDKTSQNNK